MRFELALDAEKLALFDKARLREVVLNERPDHVFELSFFLASPDSPVQSEVESAEESLSADPAIVTPFPEYVSVEDAS